ncbi:F0F1 ATP synthase subunit B [Pelagibacteraceae bacterium]|nr:F0F1 ATP synthase subunit B [Pelagibacteraceae bacterium]
MRLKIPLIIFIFWFETILFAAEAGMPQLDSKYWFSQSFWLILIFVILYLSLSKFFIPKIKDNLDDREKKIKENLDKAKEYSELAEKKNLDYQNEVFNAKKEVIKILTESKKQLDKNINQKKDEFEKELEKEIHSAEKEISNLKKNSSKSINSIAEEISGKIIENLTGEKLNNSSIKASVEEISKNKMNKYL